MLTYNR